MVRLLISMILGLGLMISSLHAEQPPSRDFKLIVPRTDRSSGQVDLRALNAQSLSSDFRILPVDPTRRQSLDRLIMKASNGRSLTFRAGLNHRGQSFIIGTTEEGDRIAVSLIDDVDGRMRVTFTVTDRDGRFINLRGRDQIFIFDATGREMCFEVEPIRTAAVPIHVGFALDVSGSMAPYSQDLNAALQGFMAQMPPHAQCTVIEFDAKYNTLAGGMRGKTLCNSLTRLRTSPPGGNTMAFPAMREMYRQVNMLTSGIKLALVVSDGVSGEGRLSEALAAKKDVTTFVNWLGNYDENYALKRFADAEIFGSANQSGMLAPFFSQAGASVSSQFVATQCKS